MIKSTVLAVATGAVLLASSGPLVPAAPGDGSAPAGILSRAGGAGIEAASLISPSSLLLGAGRPDSPGGPQSAAASLGAAAAAAAATMRYQPTGR